MSGEGPRQRIAAPRWQLPARAVRASPARRPPKREPTVSSDVLGAAVLDLERMAPAERRRLAERVRARQPHLFASIAMLPRYGVTLKRGELAWQLLLVFFLAIESIEAGGSSESHHCAEAGPVAAAWSPVPEDIQDRCLLRICAWVESLEGLAPERQREALTKLLARHPEKALLAHSLSQLGHLGEQGGLGLQTEAEKMLVLAALNLVECIAQTFKRPGARPAVDHSTRRGVR